MQLLTRKFTTQQYHQMAKTGIFDPQENLELITGEIITMSPVGFRHAFVTNYLTNFFPRNLGEQAIVSTQNPINLGNESEPRPDVVLLRPREDFYATQLPTAADILLLIEVADTSLTYDREIKISLYAQHQVPEVWLINLSQKQLECHTEIQNNTYQKTKIYQPHQSVSCLTFPTLELNLDKLFT
ncbi:Uma2 family endonuclease [[Limnothrix rosea] IAM M-220]|uniref:Uma2 family endonuclease n=1 Tax=[Limnothrix rosea] IAM M-220 TaxID=454133 RepID=UPI00095D7006|nr:Uma2 family endonuclease [[Limnothrix rosea] IAM M-220]OKH15959.1 hypothetical protein NIES208_12310 [[Limnothrix rosea] IAM M-220]